VSGAAGERRLRIAIFSRYALVEQYALAAEFRPMLEQLARRAEVLHLSLGARGAAPGGAPAPDGVRVQELPLAVDRGAQGDVLRKSLLLYALLPAAARRLRAFRPDVVFVSEILPLCALFFRWVCRTRAATAYGDWHVHNLLGRKRWARGLLRAAEALDRFEARRLTGFLCRAAAAGERLRRWGVPSEFIRVVRDAPDLAAFRPSDQRALRRRCGFAEDDVVLLYHGVMHQGKGLDRLLRWTAELRRENPRLGIILVGGGPEQEALRRLAAELQLGERAVFTGWLPTLAEVGAYCNAADICVAMRTGDEANDRVVPGALLHSMACGKVVIGPRLSGIAEIVRDGENGFLFAADDGEDFQRLVRRLAAERERWAAVGQAALRDIRERFSVETAAQQYAAALEHFARVPERL